MMPYIAHHKPAGPIGCRRAREGFLRSEKQFERLRFQKSPSKMRRTKEDEIFRRGKIPASRPCKTEVHLGRGKEFPRRVGLVKLCPLGIVHAGAICDRIV